MRKGQYEGIGIVFALLFLTLVIFIATLLFIVNRGKISEERLNSIEISENNLLLLNYLRTPVIYNSENISISDLIILKDKNKIEEESKNIFNRYCSGKCIWRLTLDYGDNKFVIDSGTDNFVSTLSNNFTLNGFNNNIIVDLEFGYNERIKGYSRLRY